MAVRDPAGKIMVRTNDETLSYEKSEDGKVRVSIAKDGEDAKLYEAASLAELKTKHPEVYERVKGFASDSGRVTLRIGRFTGGGEPAHPFGTPTPRPDVERGGLLGVHVTPVSPVLRAQLALEDGVGLVVGRVVDGSIAARCGVKRWDVLVALDGKPLKGVADMLAGLRDRDETVPTKLSVIRGGKRTELVEAAK